MGTVTYRRRSFTIHSRSRRNAGEMNSYPKSVHLFREDRSGWISLSNPTLPLAGAL
jgi:hypothetical protein